MALDFIPIKDANDVTKKVTVDLHNTDHYTQVVKVGYGGDDTTPTLVSTSNPLPVQSPAASQADGHSASIGATTDGEATGNGSLIAIVKRLRTLLGSVVSLLGGGLPAALTGSGNLKVAIMEGAASGGTAMTDDSAFTPGSTAVTPMAAMADETAPDSVNEGDAGIVRMSLNRNLYVRIRDDAGNERGLNIDANGEIGVGAGANSSVASGSVTWANSAAQGTVQNANITLPSRFDPDGLYQVNVYNPSTQTALTLRFQTRENMASADRFCELAVAGINANTSKAFLVQGWLLGSGQARIAFSNDSALNGSGGFTANFVIRQV